MTSSDWMALAPYALAGVAMIVATVLVLKAGGKPGDAVTALDTLKEVALLSGQLVKTAEQITKTGDLQPEARFNYAFENLKAHFPDLPEDQLDAAIEAAVFDLNQQKKAVPASG